MTNPVKSDDRNIEDILAAIRLQAATRTRTAAVVSEQSPSEPQRLHVADLPLMLSRDERATMASIYPFPRVTGGRLADVLRRAQEQQAADELAVAAQREAAATIVPAGVEGPVKREMVSFLDTRMSRMSAPVEHVATQDQNLIAVTPVGAPVADMVPAAAVAASDTATATTGMALQEGAAELLRPMLKQWLAENMPRIVEKALHMEIADNVDTGGGSGNLKG